jgi:predicted nucleic acid-binding protein
VGEVALDASVAIGFFEPTDVHHEHAVEAIRACREERLSIAASAYSETLVRPLAMGVGARVEQFFDRYGIEVVAADREIARVAAELRAAHRALRLPDALVLAAARSRDARLLTFDGNLARIAAGAVQS